MPGEMELLLPSTALEPAAVGEDRQEAQAGSAVCMARAAGEAERG